MTKYRTIKNAMLYTLCGILPSFVNFLLMPIMTRVLSQEDYGVLGYTNTLKMFLSIIAILSLNTYVLRFYNEEENKREMMGSITLFILFFNILFLGVEVFVFNYVIGNRIQIDFYPYIFLMLIINFLDIFNVLPQRVQRIEERVGSYSILIISRFIVETVLTILLVVVLNMGLMGKFYSMLITAILYFVVYWVITIQHIKLSLDFTYIKKALIFSIPLLPGAISFLILDISDKLILERYVSIAQLGIYTVGYTLGSVSNIITRAVYQTLEPKIYKEYSQKEFQSWFMSIKSVYLVVISMICFGMALFSKEILLIMASEKFLLAYEIIPYIAYGALLNGLYLLVSTIVIAAKDTKSVSMSTTVGAIVNIIINFLMIKYLGIMAAAIATAISFAVMAFYVLVKSKKHFLQIRYAQDIISLSMTLCFVIFYPRILMFEPWYLIVAIKIIIFILYLLILFKLYNLRLKQLLIFR